MKRHTLAASTSALPAFKLKDIALPAGEQQRQRPKTSAVMEVNGSGGSMMLPGKELSFSVGDPCRHGATLLDRTLRHQQYSRGLRFETKLALELSSACVVLGFNFTAPGSILA
jgi:hypothetical protein